MKFAVSSSELLHGLLSVSRVIASKPTLAILENFLFSLKENTLTVTASDGETTLKTNITIDQVLEEGEAAVPAKLLTDSLKEFPDQPLTFSTNAKDSTMDITWASGASKIPCLEANDFPELPSLNEISENLTIPSETLLDGINNTIYATAEEELRPVMNGIFFDIDVESTTLVASDAHKLICFTFKTASASQKSSFILHKKPASILKSILTKVSDDIIIKFDNKNAYFYFDSNVLVCRLIEGNYPAYKTVIPKNNDNKLIVARMDLLNVAKRIAVCSNQSSSQIKLKLSNNEMVVSAQDLNFSISAYEALPCQYDGMEMEIGFKAPFLIEILNNLPYQNICLELADPSKSALIVSADEDNHDEELYALLMPVMINA
ncbi:MAG: DNA polymerase III subunit beta [Bacteroidales bacterium]|nr:DNA polymerase III subunit beta [Bacteroidales bacterium]MDD4671020.1 DNA polymerase III subunit beta [Bacteroidales bacterium]